MPPTEGATRSPLRQSDGAVSPANLSGTTDSGGQPWPRSWRVPVV